MKKKNTITRRDFMRGAAGAAAVTLSAGRKVLAAAPQPGAGEAFRFGIIGVGMRGSGLLRDALTLPGAQCVAACDLWSGRRELAKEIIGKPAIITSRYEDLLHNSDIQAIIAAIPDHWHKRIVVEATAAGKDIYCEKPMSHTVAEGFEMVAAQDRTGRIVQIGSQRRSSIGFAKAKDLVDQGAIGNVTLVEAGMGRNNPCGAWEYTVPPGLTAQDPDWAVWLNDAPKRSFDPLRWTRWRCYRDYGEGIPGDLFVHALTGIHYVMGVNAPPARAYSVGGLFRWKDGRDVPDEIATEYEYPAFRAIVRVTLNTEFPEVTRFRGTGGYIDVEGDGDVVTVYPQDGLDHSPCTPAWPAKMDHDYAAQWNAEHRTKVGQSKLRASETYQTPSHYNDTAEHLWNFVQSTRTRRPSVEDAHFGNNTAICCHMANYSYFNHGEAIWDAEGRKITKG